MSEKTLMMPDYENCIANIPNSVLHYFGVETVGKTLPLLERYRKKDYKNVVLLLLDGMGVSILEKHLKEKGAFRSHLAGCGTSVFLSTTVAATTSAMTGLQPCEHSWLGWECYYPQIDKNVTVFLNTEQGTEKPAAEYNVAHTINPFISVTERLRKAGIAAYEVAPFAAPYPQCIEEICAFIEDLCERPERKYIYAYWKQPDGLLHRNGCKSKVVKEALIAMEKEVAKLAEKLQDTLLIVTADHGHIDTKYKVLQKYPDLMDCLVRMPSLEPRVLNFFVKEERKEDFEILFREKFGEKFLLMPMEEAVEKKLFGTGMPHKNFRGMLGDYLAIATDDLSIFFNDERWKSMHGSLTEEEMRIPFIVFEC